MALEEAGCPEQFAACLLPEDASKLADNLIALRRYAEEVYRLCGPVPKVLDGR